MSLSFEEFSEAIKEHDRVSERLQGLFGFDPSFSDHYGVIRLYNEVIRSDTPSERLLEIRQRYLKWKEEILEIFLQNGVSLDAERLHPLFRLDGMFGVLYFLEEPVNIYGELDVFRRRISELLAEEGARTFKGGEL
ncbi:MAG: hypothetical protein IKT72_00565 [Clostridia bacterium]|nr:hypothetical protein [Clostridia bacterium]